MRSNLVHRGRAIDLEGKTWREEAPRLDRETLDAVVETGFSRRGYRGKRSGATMRTRLVALWDEEHREYHAYLTNLPVNVSAAEELAELYRLRWEVEHLFREAKGVFKMDREATKNRHVAGALIWTGWLALLASRRVYNAFREALPPEKRAHSPARRWAKAWASVARDYLKEVLKHLGREWRMAQPLEELSTRIWAEDSGITVEDFRREWLA